MPKRILVVDDDAASRTGLAGSAGAARLPRGSGGDRAPRHWKRHAASGRAVVIADLVMPGMDGLELLRNLQDEAPFAVTILLTGQGSDRDGGSGHESRGLRLPHQARRSRASHPSSRKSHGPGPHRPRGGPPAAAEWERRPSGAARSERGHTRRCSSRSSRPRRAPPRSSILGESGTGKELVARTLHALSPRARRLVCRSQLCRHSREPPGERDLRPREGRLHRSGRTAHRLLRNGGRRDAPPRRGGRDASHRPGEIPARLGGSGPSGALAERRRSRWTSGSSRRPIRIRRRPCATASFAQTSSTA